MRPVPPSRWRQADGVEKDPDDEGEIQGKADGSGQRLPRQVPRQGMEQSQNRDRQSDTRDRRLVGQGEVKKLDENHPRPAEGETFLRTFGTDQDQNRAHGQGKAAGAQRQAGPAVRHAGDDQGMGKGQPSIDDDGVRAVGLGWGEIQLVLRPALGAGSHGGVDMVTVQAAPRHGQVWLLVGGGASPAIGFGGIRRLPCRVCSVAYHPPSPRRYPP